MCVAPERREGRVWVIKKAGRYDGGGDYCLLHYASDW